MPPGFSVVRPGVFYAQSLNKNSMKAEFIYTPHVGEQIFRPSRRLPAQYLKDKYALMTFAMKQIPISKQGNIVKISVCVESETRPPDWYLECNGKIWADDLENWRQMTGLKSTIPPAYF